MADISKITPPGSETTYNLKDATAREQAAENKNNISLLATKGGGYNYAKIGTNSYSGYGLTVTVVNGVVTLSGTATGSFSLYLSGTITDSLSASNKLSTQLPTQIAFTGAPNTETKNRIIFGLYYDDTWVYSGSTNDLYHDLTGKTYNNWLIYLPIVSGNTYNGTWRPMIIDKSVYDSGFTDFQPYALPNTKITPELIELVDSGAKNLLPNRGQLAMNGVTYTWNSDGTVTVSGAKSASTENFVNVVNTTDYANLGLKAGDKIVISNNGTNTYVSVIFWGTGGYSSSITAINGSTEITLSSDYTKILIRLASLSAATSISETISPMVCTKAAWDVSQKFVPYRPTYEETVEQVAENKNNILSLNQVSQYNMAGTYNSETGRASFAELYKLALDSLGLDASVLHHYIVLVYTNTVSPTADLLIMYGTYYYNNSISHAVLYNSQLSYYADNKQGTLLVSGGDDTIQASVRFLD